VLLVLPHHSELRVPDDDLITGEQSSAGHRLTTDEGAVRGTHIDDLNDIGDHKPGVMPRSECVVQLNLAASTSADVGSSTRHRERSTPIRAVENNQIQHRMGTPAKMGADPPNAYPNAGPQPTFRHGSAWIEQPRDWVEKLDCVLCVARGWRVHAQGIRQRNPSGKVPHRH